MAKMARHSESNTRFWRHPAVVIAATGLALGVATTADAVTRTRLSLRPQQLGQFAGSQAMQGSTVVVANFESAHVWPTHEAFGSRVNRVWWPANSPAVNQEFIGFLPPEADGEIGAARGLFYGAHATAAASALAGNWQQIDTDAFLPFPSVIGFAPGAKMVLSTAFAGGRSPDGIFIGDSATALGFSILALTDPKVAGFAANMLGIPEYEVATVVNVSFGSVSIQNDRMGETIVTHAFDVAVNRNDPVIVAAVGDENENPVLQMEIMQMGDPGGTVAAPASAYNTVRVGRLDVDQTAVADESGVGPLTISNYPKTQGLILSSISPLEFPMGCTPAFMGENLNVGARTGPHIMAPGTMMLLAGSPAIDPPTIAPVAADSAWASLWTGTSFSSALVAGAATLIQDVGNKMPNDPEFWPADFNGVRKPSGLATRAILLTAVDPSNQPNIPNNNGADGTLEEDACIFERGAADDEGIGNLDFERINLILFGNQARDVRSDRPMLVDNIFRTLDGFTRGGFDPAQPYSAQRYRSDPPVPPWSGQSMVNIINNMVPIPFDGTQIGEITGEFQAWNEGWMTNLRVPTTGTDLNVPFVTTVQVPVDPAPMMVTAQPNSAPDDSMIVNEVVEEAADVAPATKSRYKEYGQPSVTPPPDPDLNGERFDLGGGQMTPLPPNTAGPGNGADSGGNGARTFRPIKSGWDVGRIGVGYIDYPLGVITPMSTIRATLVYNRTEVWSESDIDTLAAPVGFKEMEINATLVRFSQDDFLDGMTTFPPPAMSDPGFELPNYQEAFALENLDLELYRENPNGDAILIAASRSMGDTLEHISVGDDGVCQPGNFSDIVFGSYFLRVVYDRTLGDFGGYEHCGMIQSLQLLRPAPMNQHNDNQRYGNLWPSEVPFGVAWIADLANSPELSALATATEEPQDFDGNGVIDEVDFNQMMMAAYGDLNTDGVINATDLSMLLTKFGTNDPVYDLNNDGDVNGADISTILARFGQTPIQ